jgi:hypothetical protein
VGKRCADLAQDLASLAVAALLLAACAPGSADGDAALLGFVEAQNRGDADAAAAMFAPDGLYQGVLVCSPIACVGRPAIGEALATEAGDRTRHRLHARSPLGDERRRDEVRWDSLATLADRIVCDVAIDVGPGGIISMRFVPDASDSATGRVLAAQARVREWLEDRATAGGEGPLTLPFPPD